MSVIYTESLSILGPAARHRPVPLDAYVSEGVAIWDQLQARDIVSVLDRVDDVLDRMRAERNRHFGACITYAIGLEPTDLAKVDDIVLDAIGNRSSYGLDPTPSGLRGIESWRGAISGNDFSLHKFAGAIALNDGTVPGSVYSLHTGVPQ